MNDSPTSAKPFLKGYGNWVRADSSKKLSLFDYLNILSQTEKVDAEVILTFVSFLWPEFQVVEGRVFLREEFSQERYDHTLKYRDSQPFEYLMNQVPLSSMFPSLSFEAQKFLGETVVACWTTKLKLEFPNKEFVVFCTDEDDEPEDLWCGFYLKPSGERTDSLASEAT